MRVSLLFMGRHNHKGIRIHVLLLSTDSLLLLLLLLLLVLLPSCDAEKLKRSPLSKPLPRPESFEESEM